MNRRATVLVRLDLPERLLHEDVLYPVLGHLIGRRVGRRIPVIEGLPSTTTEDNLKALGAAAASSGSVAMFHAVGITPEAPDLGTALAGVEPELTIEVDSGLIILSRDELTTAESGTLRAVSLGTPHMSVEEFERLLPLVSGREVHNEVDFYINTGRGVLDEIRSRGWLDDIERSGAQIVTDTCTYITPILQRRDGVVMTDSAKWAYYAPGNLGVEVAFGSTEECVQSALAGRIIRIEGLWRDL